MEMKRIRVGLLAVSIHFYRSMWDKRTIYVINLIRRTIKNGLKTQAIVGL